MFDLSKLPVNWDEVDGIDDFVQRMADTKEEQLKQVVRTISQKSCDEHGEHSSGAVPEQRQRDAK